MLRVTKSFFRYLPVPADARAWGLHVIDGGSTRIGAGQRYPPRPHPPSHDFDWQRGRVLQEFQLIHITRGRGQFESSESKPREVRKGDVIVLFPEVWHRYRPDPTTGWDEHWVGFDGEQAKRIVAPPLFSSASPVLKLGPQEEILRLFLSINDALENQPQGFPPILAAQTMEILARLVAATSDSSRHKRNRRIQEACCQLIERVDEDIDLVALAKSLGLSYPHFRRLFRSETGFAPHQFQLETRIRKAQTLLLDTELSASEIGESLGFRSLFHFSRAFKKRTEQSPTTFRARARAKRP